MKDDEPRAERELAINGQPAAVGQKHEQIQMREPRHRGRIKAHGPKDLALLIVDCAVGRCEFFDFLPFAGKALDDMDALKILGEGENQLVDQLAVAIVGRADESREGGRRQP